MRRLIVLTVLTATAALSIATAWAQQDPTVIRIEKVKDALYIVAGGRGPGEQTAVGGNTTVKYRDYNMANLKADVQRVL